MSLERIGKLKEKVLEISNLTPGGQLKNDERSGKLKTRRKKAEELLEETNHLQEELYRNIFDRLELEIANTFEMLNFCKERLEKLELARKKKSYLSGIEIIKEYRENEKRLQELKEVTSEKERLDKELVEIKTEFAKFDLTGDTADDIYKNVRVFKENYDQLKTGK